MLAVGSALMVTEAVVVFEQPLPSVTEYVTVYVAGVLVTRLISPVLALMFKPAVELNVPPEVPVSVTEAVPVAQYGLPA